MKFLISGDWHLRERTPQARTDDYFAAQEKKVGWVLNLAQKREASILHAGDLINSEPPSRFVLRWFIQRMIDEEFEDFYTVFGQHEMLHHSLKSLNRTGLSVLDAAGTVKIVDSDENLWSFPSERVELIGCHWGQEIPRREKVKGWIKILLIHRMIVKQELWAGQTADYGKAFLMKHNEYDLIVSGDNHQHFMFQVGDRYLFNAGSLMRMKADQLDHKPCVGLYDTETKELEVVEVPCTPAEEVLSREHIEEVQRRDERRQLLVKSLKEGYKIALSYKNNLQGFFEKNKTKEEVRNLIWENI